MSPTQQADWPPTECRGWSSASNKELDVGWTGHGVRRLTSTAVVGVVMLAAMYLAGSPAFAADELERDFATPPDAARPWVICYWMGGNITKEGITAQLEAMQRVGIGGATVMDIGIPREMAQGPVRFLSPEWREMFKHFVAESARLGLEVNVQNSAGWSGSGGPWIKPDQSVRKVVISETVVEGPVRFDAALVRPAGHYPDIRDIAVLAFPEPRAGTDGKLRRLDAFDSSKTFSGGIDHGGVQVWPRFIDSLATWPLAPREECVPVQGVVNVTERMTPDGRLTWDVPPGRWMIQRIGHVVHLGARTRTAQAEGVGPECDKMSKAALETNFNAMMAVLIADIGPLAGKALVSTHVESWEAGSGNWTAEFRAEFRKRRGYDLLLYLPVLNGIVVESVEVSERFLWDWRQTAAHLLVENYAEHLVNLSKKQGLRTVTQAYEGPCDDMRYAGRADEPQTEFWAHGMNPVQHDYTKQATSVAHI